MQGGLRFFLSAFIVLSLTATAGSALAVTANDLKATENKLNETRQKIRQGEANKQQLNQEIKSADERLSVVEGELGKLQGQLTKARQAKDEITAKLNRLRAELAKTQGELDKATARLKELTVTLNRRAGNAYKHGDVSFLEVLLDARDFSDFISRARFITTILNVDARLVREIKGTKSAIEQARTAIEENRNQTQAEENALAGEVNRLASLTAAERSKQSEVEAQINSKKQLVSKIEQDKASWLAAEAEFARSAARIRAQLSAGGATPVIGARSASGFIWPASGGVSSGFGPRWGRMHTGIDIPVAYGSPVVAAKAGRVAIAEWYGGYGNLVVIDHGGGISTWYGHNSSFTVSAGQSVSQGQVIAKAGSTGHSTGPHVHFEVRINGNAVNPLNYLP